MTATRPRWITLREVPAVARLVCNAFGGRYLRRVVTVAVTPHLTVDGHTAVLGIGAHHGHSSFGWRVVDSVLHVVWTATATFRRGDHLPWVLHPVHTTGWRLVNLANDPARPSMRSTIALAAYVLDLADRIGMDAAASVRADRPRLLIAYRRRGFLVVESRGDILDLYRVARRQCSDTRWRSVLRTGRLTLSAWQRRFGTAVGPFLDVGAGDSPLAGELTTLGVPAVTIDPQYSARPPASQRFSVAATAEALPFCDASFATVNANFVMQHVSRPRLALRECLRVTRRDGRLVMHPVWSWRFNRARLGRLPGVRLLHGRLLPPGRMRPSMVVCPDAFDFAAHGAQVAAALRPNPVVASLGRLAMRLVARGTS